ncbi:hypothetical protein [Spiroplasma endosymbiont of Labia minor]|uniref:hypothetical protein n=1 Tax=Spiroplasma endosymbiont of Labia minor TaxID=3066305 RepID=UPI0030D0A584
MFKQQKFKVDQDLEYKKFDQINLDSKITKNIGLYIWGKPGVGKTTFLNKFKKDIHSRNNSLNKDYELNPNKYVIESNGIKYSYMPKMLNVHFCNMQQLVSDFKWNWNRDKDESKKTNKIPNFVKADVLLIDDLGAEHAHSSTYEYIYELFNKRFDYIQKNKDKKMYTLISSNFSIQELTEKYIRCFDDINAERLISRISGLINYEINFIGIDKRWNEIKTDKEIDTEELEFD